MSLFTLGVGLQSRRQGQIQRAGGSPSRSERRIRTRRALVVLHRAMRQGRGERDHDGSRMSCPGQTRMVCQLRTRRSRPRMVKIQRARVAPAVVLRSRLQPMPHRARHPESSTKIMMRVPRMPWLFFRSTVLLSPRRLATTMHTRRHYRAAADTLRLRLLLPTVDLSRPMDLRPYRLDPTLSSAHSALLQWKRWTANVRALTA